MFQQLYLTIYNGMLKLKNSMKTSRLYGWSFAVFKRKGR